MADKRYTAIFDARDQVSDKLKRIEQATHRARDAQGRFVKMTEQADRAQDRMRQSTNQAVNAMERMRRVALTAGNGFATFGRNGMNAVRTVSGAVGGLVSSLMSLPALIAGAGAAFGAWKLGDAVLGGALRQEMNETQLMGLSGSDQTGQALFDMIKSEAMNSTFSTGEFMAAAKSYMGFTRDPEEMKGYLELTKRLALFDPVQGTEGAAVAIKEALSGDLMSLSERFEMPRSMLYANGFDSKADAKTNFEAVMKTIEQQGLTADAVKKFESTGMAQLQQLKNKSSDWLGQMGREAVEEMKPFFERINSFFGSPQADKFVDTMNGKLGGLMDRLTTNMSTISWDDIENGLTNGYELMRSIGETGLVFMDAMSGSEGGSPVDIMRNFADSIGDAAKKISDFNEDLRSMFKWIEESSVLNWIKDTSTGNTDEDGRRKGVIRWAYDGFSDGDWSTRTSGSHMGGLSFVPKDNYQANLHKGERVLTAQENRAYTQGGTGDVIFTGNTFNVRNEQDIDAIGNALLMKLQMRG